MKKIITLVLVLSLSALVFGQDQASTKTIKADESQVTWTGKKVTGEHAGTIDIKSGQLVFGEDGKLTGGEFTMDMTSIQCTDLEGESKGKLEGHLASEDFFNIEKNPIAKLIITDVKNEEGDMYTITGELTIKDITQTVTFKAEVGADAAMADIVIDRTKYEIKYGSGSFFDDLGDKTIYDDFDLKVSLTY